MTALKSARYLALASVMAVCVDSAMAQVTEVRAGHAFPPSHPLSTAGYIPMIEAAKERGLDVQYYDSGTLVDIKSTLSALNSGLIDVGMIGLTYFPAQFPNGQLVSDMGMAAPSSLAAALAASEYNMLHCADCQAEFNAQGVVYTGTYSTAPFTLISKMPIRDVEDLQGKKIRSAGPLWSRWINSVGAIEVNLSFSELFQALDVGALDVAMQSVGALRSHALWDAADYVTDVNLGTYHSVAVFLFAADYWDQMSPEQRHFFLTEGARATVDITLTNNRADLDAIAEAPNHSVEIVQPSDAFVAEKDDYVEADMVQIAEIAREKYGIDDASEKISVFVDLMTKWQRLLDDVGHDNRDAILRLVHQEIIDKLPENYGVN